MSSRPQIKPFSVITNGDMSASITSEPTILSNLSMCSYQISWAGTAPVGTVAVQFSNTYALNPDGTVGNAGTWDTATLNYMGSQVQSIPVTGNADSGFIDISDTAAYAVRLVYTATSGVGTLQATLAGKVQ